MKSTEGSAFNRSKEVIKVGPACEGETSGSSVRCVGGTVAAGLGVEIDEPRNHITAGAGFVLESAGNDLLSPWKDYHRPQVLIVRVRDGNASFHLGVITGKLPDISVTTWWVRS
jgi:hypothetical protein